MPVNFTFIKTLPCNLIHTHILPLIHCLLHEYRHSITLCCKLPCRLLNERAIAGQNDVGRIRVRVWTTFEASRHNPAVYGWKIGLHAAANRGMYLVARVQLSRFK